MSTSRSTPMGNNAGGSGVAGRPNCNKTDGLFCYMMSFARGAQGAIGVFPRAAERLDPGLVRPAILGRLEESDVLGEHPDVAVGVDQRVGDGRPQNRRGHLLS